MAKNIISSAVTLLLLTGIASAQTTGPKRILYPIAVVGPQGMLPNQFRKAITFDFDVSGSFRSVKGLRDGKGISDMTIDPEYWKNKGVFGVTKFQAKMSGQQVVVDVRLFEVEKGEDPVFGRTYRGVESDLKRFGHMWATEVNKYHTKSDGFFRSSLVASVKQGKTKQLVVFGHDGGNARTITRNRSINLLPSWGRKGGILFTSYMRRNPDLYRVGPAGGRPKLISRRRGMNTGGVLSPDGSKIAVTLSKDGNPEIYILKADSGTIIKRITSNTAIDASPSWSPDGRELAFVSDRQGGPQIFVVSASGGSAKRVSFNGSYNTTPVWSPVAGERRLAYTTRDGGKYDVVTLDLNNKKMHRVTQGQGQNESPAWSPDGKAIAFVSRRKAGNGVYISNAQGTSKQYRVFKGSAGSLSWGPNR